MTTDDSTAEKALERAISDVSHSLESWFGSNLDGWPDNPTKFFGTPAREAVAAGYHARDAEVADLQAELHFERTGECPSCRGTGVIDSAEHKCGACGGRGYMVPAEVESLREQLAEAQATIAEVKATLDPDPGEPSEFADFAEGLEHGSAIKSAQIERVLSAPSSTGGNRG